MRRKSCVWQSLIDAVPPGATVSFLRLNDKSKKWSLCFFQKETVCFRQKGSHFPSQSQKSTDFSRKVLLFSHGHIPPPLPAAPCKKAPLPVGRGAFFFIYRFFFTEQPRQPSGHPRGRCSPTSRPDQIGRASCRERV